MIITLASFKGGVGKSTTAIHLAALLEESARTLLVDSDKTNRSVTKWWQRGDCQQLKFNVIDDLLLAREGRKYDHIVIDTKAAPTKEDLENLVKGSDLLIIPCFPQMMALDTLADAGAILSELRPNSYRVLLTCVPPRPQKDGAEAREVLESIGLPIFKSEIRQTKAFQRASQRGMTVDQIREYDNYMAAWNDYTAVLDEINGIVMSENREEC